MAWQLIELMEYEREQGNTASMDISTKSVSRIVGKRGAQAEKIKEDSGLQSLDIDKLDSSEGVSRVTMKGSKAAIVAAKKMINSIVQTVDDECFAKVKIPRAYHQALIGRGGARCKCEQKRSTCSLKKKTGDHALICLHSPSTRARQDGGSG
jgi:predicted PilT family ATPase